MKKHNFLSFLYFMGFLAVVSALYSFTTNAIAEPDYYLEINPKWQNLKVLPQDITKDELMDVMNEYNAALGVKCSHCHTFDKEANKMNFADDSKQEKHYTRHMIKMTQEINANYFNWENHPEPEKINVVNCVMCHRGVAKPTEHLKNLKAAVNYFEIEEE